MSQLFNFGCGVLQLDPSPWQPFATFSAQWRFPPPPVKTLLHFWFALSRKPPPTRQWVVFPLKPFCFSPFWLTFFFSVFVCPSSAVGHFFSPSYWGLSRPMRPTKRFPCTLPSLRPHFFCRSAVPPLVFIPPPLTVSNGWGHLVYLYFSLLFKLFPPRLHAENIFSLSQFLVSKTHFGLLPHLLHRRFFLSPWTFFVGRWIAFFFLPTPPPTVTRNYLFVDTSGHRISVPPFGPLFCLQALDSHLQEDCYSPQVCTLLRVLLWFFPFS